VELLHVFGGAGSSLQQGTFGVQVSGNVLRATFIGEADRWISEDPRRKTPVFEA